jgi:inhibitor of cysteine peptidase
MNNDMDELKKEYDNIEVPPEVDLAIEKGIKNGKAYKRKTIIKPFALIAASLVLAVGIISVGKFFSTNNTSLIAANYSKSLPTVGSSNNLQKLLATYIGQNNGIKYDANKTEGVANAPTMPLEKSFSSAAIKGKGNNQLDATKDYSTTNLQVQGVDEEDLVKTDGEFIFKVNAQKIINVIKAEPASNMEAVNNITFEDNYNISGIFLRDKTLVVVGNSYQNIEPQSVEQSRDSIMQPNQVTKIISFDVSDKKNIKKIREVEIEGSYNSSRMIESRIYVITNKYLSNISNIKEDESTGKVYYKDSVVGKDKIAIDYKTINYLPDSIQPNYIMVGSYNVDDNKEKVSINTILGSGNSIYSSDKNLYIAGTKWVKKDNSNGYNIGITNTIIYKFAFENTGVKFVAKGEVPGTITNQFSMDESKENFRIATTEYNYGIVTPMIDGKTAPENNGTTSVAPSAQDKNMTKKVQNQITNNLYILDKDMKAVGKLQGLANGEQIYSVRFIGDRAYVVTFMLTDPLFVIDLKDPSSPKVLGELKISGFTNYLHPYDETHLIGFGMDTTVINEGGMDRAKREGMKIAIFDVSDVAKPVQQFMTIIGGPGTYSEVLNNHKALLFSKEKNLLALPITENNYGYNTNNSEQSYQGAYIYSIDLVNGIKLKGKITHVDAANNSGTNNPSGQSTLKYPNYNGQYFVDRILYIKDTLYTLSNGLIKANDINTLQEKSKLTLKTIDYSKAYPTDGIKKID